MAQTRRSHSIHSRKKPLPSDVLAYIGSHLDKNRKRDTLFGMIFSISEILRSLQWPDIKTEFYQDKTGPQALTTFPFTTPPISDDKETRETVYKRTAENVRQLGSCGVPQNTLWNLLADFDPWNRKELQYVEELVTAIRTALDGERKKLQQLNLFLSAPPTLHPLPPEYSTGLVAFASQFQRKMESVEQAVQGAVRHLSIAKKNYASKRSPHLAKVKDSLFQLIQKNTGWSRNRTAKEQTVLLSRWNADLAGKDNSKRTGSYRR